MPFVIQDGYTVPFATKPEIADPITGRVVVEGLPVVTGTYRPATFREMQSYWFAHRSAKTGAEQADIVADFIADHLKTWDVEMGDGRLAAVVPSYILAMPETLANQLFEIVSTWAAKSQGEAAKN